MKHIQRLIALLICSIFGIILHHAAAHAASTLPFTEAVSTDMFETATFALG